VTTRKMGMVAGTEEGLGLLGRVVSGGQEKLLDDSGAVQG